MTKKLEQKQNQRESLKEEGTFLAQSNIDDLLEEKQSDIDTQEVKIIDYENIEKEIEINKDNDNNNANDTEIVNSLQKQKIDEAEQSVSKKNSKKSKIINLVFFLLNIVIVAGLLVFQLSKEKIEALPEKINLVALLAVIFIFIATILADTFGISYLLKQATGKWKFATSYKVSQIGRYYDNVTPMASGGQAFQVTYLKSRGTPLHTSLSIPLAKYIFSQISWVLISLVSLIVSFVDKSYGTFVSIMSIIGFVLSFLLLSVTFFLCVCKTVGKKIVIKVLKLLYKMKIVKNYDKQYEKITKYISDFQDVMKQYAKSPKDFSIMLISTLAYNILRYSMPFFIVSIFIPNLSGIYYIKLMVMTILVDLSASFFPMPGGTGLNEISFNAAFGGVIEGLKTAGVISDTNGILIWVLLIWRFFSYYLYLIQGVCLLSYDTAYGNRKYKWLVKKENLIEESMVFKQNQINKFRADRAKRRKNKQKNTTTKEYL